MLRWKNTLARRGFELAPDEEVSADVRLRLPDGEEIIGADVYRFVMRRIWWAYPLYLLSRLPLLRSLYDRAYRAFADSRHHISNACGLTDDLPR